MGEFFMNIRFIEDDVVINSNIFYFANIPKVIRKNNKHFFFNGK